MPENPTKNKPPKTVPSIKIVKQSNTHTINNDSTLSNSEWQQQKSSKRSLPNSPVTPDNNQGKKQNYFSHQTGSPHYLQMNLPTIPILPTIMMFLIKMNLNT